MDRKEVTGWSDGEILDAVRERVGKDLVSSHPAARPTSPCQSAEISPVQNAEEKTKLKLRMEKEERGTHVAVVLNFDGPFGLVIIDNKWLKTGNEKPHGGRYLYFTTNAETLGDPKPDLRFVYLEGA